MFAIYLKATCKTSANLVLTKKFANSSHSQLPLLSSKVCYHSLRQTEKLPNCTNGKIESHGMCSAILSSLSQDCGHESVQLVEGSVL